MPTAKPRTIPGKCHRRHPALLSRPRLDEYVVPFTECRRRLAEYFEKARTTHRQIIVTQNGRTPTLLVNISVFEDMRETLELMEAVRIAEEQIERGEVIPQAEARRQSRERLLALQEQLA